MRRSLLVANWKMNGSAVLLQDMHRALMHVDASVDVVLCPPFVLLPQTEQLFKESQITYGAQDVSDQNEGAYTGQISAKMLSQLACDYVIIGHSERRQYCGESDALIAAKCARALEAGLIPILCVGENATQKQQGQTDTVIRAQVEAVVNTLSAQQITKLVIAYEPVWAIGTGQAADPIDANAVHTLIRQCVVKDVKILYGGSVNAENIRAFLSEPQINGALIGGASLKPDVFVQMIKNASFSEIV